MRQLMGAADTSGALKDVGRRQTLTMDNPPKRLSQPLTMDTQSDGVEIIECEADCHYCHGAQTD
jgi:hypothetical protein